MKNTWKRLSKINPQREDGTRQINNDVFRALIKAKLPTSEMSIVLTIISKTWGFGKKSDVISISQFSRVTGFTNRAIQKSNVSLVKKRIIVVTTGLRVNCGSPLNEYMFNKHYDTWKIGDSLRVNHSSGGELSGKIRVNHSSPTKESITKESIYTPNFKKFWEAYPKRKGKGAAFKAYQNIKEPRPSLSIILNSINATNQTEQWQTKQFIPYPATWLNQRRWEDEIEETIISIRARTETEEDIKNELKEKLA